MKTEGPFSKLYFFHTCENTERIVSITTLMNQCSSSNRATKHFLIFTYNIFSLFPQTHSLSLSPPIISDFLFFFYIFFRLVFVFFMARPFPSFLSTSLISNFYFSGIKSASLSHILGSHQSEIHIYQANLQLFHICSNFVICFFNYTRILRNTSSLSIETHVRNNTKSIF